MSTNYSNRKKIEKLHRHKTLTTEVKLRLRKFKEKLEKDITLIDVLLEKPTKKIKTSIFD